MTICTLATLLGLALLTNPAAASDALEQRMDGRWVEVLSESAAARDIVQLQSGADKFLALYRKDVTGIRHGGVLLLHTLGAHPDWPEVIAPLRRALPGYGWDSLAIQLPALGAHAGIESYAPLFEEAALRIEAAIGFLRTQGIETVVLAGHGLGATVGAAFLSRRSGHGVSGFIAIGIASNNSTGSGLDVNEAIAKIRLPMLDIYGERDWEAAEGAPERAAAARAAGQMATPRQDLAPFRSSASSQEGLSKHMGLIAFRQYEIPGAGNGFVGYERVLVKRIIGWLKHHAGGITLPESERPD